MGGNGDRPTQAKNVLRAAVVILSPTRLALCVVVLRVRTSPHRPGLISTMLRLGILLVAAVSTASSARRGPGNASLACSSGLTGDTETISCSPFCDGNKASNHCKFCKCRGCPYCAAALKTNANSGKRTPCRTELTGDFPYRTCAAFCKTTRASDHCGFCKCSDCPFCLARTGPERTGRLAGTGLRPHRSNSSKAPSPHQALRPRVARAPGITPPDAAGSGAGGTGGESGGTAGLPPAAVLLIVALAAWLLLLAHVALQKASGAEEAGRPSQIFALSEVGSLPKAASTLAGRAVGPVFG